MSKIEKPLLISIAIAYIVFFVSTILHLPLFRGIASPITNLLVAVLVLSQIRNLGPFKWSSIFMSSGVLCWAFADIIKFLNNNVIEIAHADSYTSALYALPCLFFALTMTVYMGLQLRGRKHDLSSFMANTFCISIIGFVVMYRIMFAFTDESASFYHIKTLFFFFLDFYSVMMCIQMFYLMGVENIVKGTTITGFAVLGYGLLDIQYVLFEALGRNPENELLDTVYVLFMIMMSLGTTIQLHRQYDFHYRSWDYSTKGMRNKILYSVAGIIFTIAAVIIGFLHQVEGSYIIIALLAYIIMTYILWSDILSEKLLEHQTQQNTLLENKIKEKTKDLENANEHLKIISSTDALTGLYNRRYGWDAVKAIREKAISEHTQFAIFSIDLNHFKPVNDTYGHEMGDHVLEEFGKRLKNLPDGYIAVRQGGDEFLVCRENLFDMTEAENIARMLQSIFSKPIIYETYIFHLSASIGVSIFPDDSENEETLIQYADAAMYTIKHSKNKDGYCFFDKKMVSMVSRKKMITVRLKNAVIDEDFVLYFQPQVDVESQKLIGLETFPHFSGDMEEVSPSDIVPIAEEIGIMSDLGKWIVESAVKYVDLWEKRNKESLSVTVNLSPLQLIDADFLASLDSISSAYEIPQNRIILDVANEVIMGAAGSAKEALKNLHNKGYKLSLNDFGGGDLNLSDVLECRFDTIKLSRKLIASATTNEETIKLIRSILGIADAMNIEVIAVGIENDVEVELMKSLGITHMQGYLYGKPTRSDMFKGAYNLRKEQRPL